MKEKYYHTQETAHEYIQLAKGVNGKQLIEKLELFLPNGSILLEIGSGPGSDWEILSRTFKVTGSDNSKPFLQYLNEKNPIGEFLELDAVTLLTDKKFDGIYSNKVLHHLSDTELQDSIKRQYDVLNPNGIICHSFWGGEGSEIFKGMFVNYHEIAGLRELFEAYFEIISIEAYKEFEDGDSLLLLARRK